MFPEFIWKNGKNRSVTFHGLLVLLLMRDLVVSKLQSLTIYKSKERKQARKNHFNNKSRRLLEMTLGKLNFDFHFLAKDEHKHKFSKKQHLVTSQVRKSDS